MRTVEIINRPVDPHGHVIQDDTLIEIFEFGGVRLKPSGKTVADITIEIARHTDGLWMWSTSGMIRGGYSGYRVGPKWGKFVRTRDDAIAAARKEIEARDPPSTILEWLESLCAPVQQELFA